MDAITEEYMPFLRRLCLSLPVEALDEFRKVEQVILARSMKLCGMADYPEVTGDSAGERCSGEMLCDKCGQDYFHHPPDWRVIGYGNVPFLNVLCDGRRVKL